MSESEGIPPPPLDLNNIAAGEGRAASACDNKGRNMPLSFRKYDGTIA